MLWGLLMFLMLKGFIRFNSQTLVYTFAIAEAYTY